MASEMVRLVKQRGIIKSKLTRFKNYIQAFNSTTSSIGELQFRYEKFENLDTEFDNIQSEIELLGEAEEIESTERVEFEKDFYSIKDAATKLINNKIVRTPSENSKNCMQNFPSRLPEIKLPVFSGLFSEWINFHDTFSSLVHQNSLLSNVDKFQYLKTSVIGEAARVIQSITISDQNYSIAWKKLIERFEDRESIILKHVQSLFDLTVVAKESPSQLRQLADEASNNLDAIYTLDESGNLAHRLLVYFVSQKLDYKTKREWENKIADIKAPSISYLLNFITNRAKLLDKFDNQKSHHSDGKTSRSESSMLNKTKRHSTLNYLSTQNANCTFCNNSHMIYVCDSFLKLPVSSRISECKSRKLCLNCLKRNHFSRECKSTTTCRKCSKKHHTSLHIENAQPEISVTEPGPSTNLHCTNRKHTSTLLSTAMVIVYDSFGNERQCRAILDSGAQSHFITEGLCKSLKLSRTKTLMPVLGINQSSTNIHYSTQLKIKSSINKFEKEIPCLIIPKLTEHLPNDSIETSHLNIPNNVLLADPNFNMPAKIDLLIGASLFWDLLCIGRMKLANSNLILHETKLGWIIAGSYNNLPTKTNCHISINQKIHNQISKFWELEAYRSDKPMLSREEQICENHFTQTVKRAANGQFEVSIPFKANVTKLGGSYHKALRRFYSLEAKLNKNQVVKNQYIDFMNEYESLGHMTELTHDNIERGYYLPHHAVFKDSTTTKLRVVFDASSQTTSGLSLNDVQLTGPSLQNDIFNILLRFRQHQFVLKADITKMYRQILITPEQRHFQKIIWRSDVDQKLKVYQLNTVTYGQSSAAFLAIRSLVQLAQEHRANSPIISNIIMKDFYIDDLITGSDTINAVLEIKNEISAVLDKAKLELRKWDSNITNENSIAMPLFSENIEAKTLGILWNSKSDDFKYFVNLYNNKRITKRIILSEISQIFDPLGLVGPCIIQAKLILQKLWQLELSWDEQVSSNLSTQWTQFQNELPHLNDITIPRHVICSQPQIIELHGFCDASQLAYGASVYLKSIDASGHAFVHLLCAKSRVAPLKVISLPRLELCGALTLAQLSRKVKDSLTIKFNREVYWTDSTITLAWISAPPTRWKQFVANRVTEIQELTDQANWRHIPTSENPADIISRGCNPEQLKESRLWWYGPKFIELPETAWPSTQSCISSNLPEEICNQHVMFNTQPKFDLFNKFSCFKKLRRIVTYILRFYCNCKIKKQEIHKRISGPLTPQELNNSERVLIRLVQNAEFNVEMRELLKNKQVHRSSKLLSLTPFLDSDNIMRVGGRLKNSEYKYEQKHPVILPGNHPFTKLLIIHEHLKLMHAGASLTLASLRINYWPLSGRNSVRQVVRKCIRCFRIKPSSLTPLMGNLPSYRVTPCRPFIKTGMDYAGPFLIKEGTRRSRRLTKAYIALFVCMATKAVHIELVSDLTTDTFLAALQRFMSRRGKVTDLFSDNGTQFIGANNQLKNLKELFENEINGSKIINTLAEENIVWHFMPPRAPHFGGLWEASIKSIENHSKRIIGDANLTFESMSTFLTQIEAILNSRPLTPISNDPHDPCCLTPGHFLIGDTLTATPHPDVTQLPDNRLSQWQHIEKLRQHFWTRWSKEYISLLQERSNWQTNHENQVKIGDLVLIKEEHLPPLRWLLGRITILHPGADGI